MVVITTSHTFLTSPTFKQHTKSQVGSIPAEGAMAQGKPFTIEERASIIESVRPFLEMGLSRNKACEAIGLDPTTLSKWVQDDEALSMKLKGFENTMNMLALSNINSALSKEAETDDAKKETSKWYLERRMKHDFSTRTENTGAEGGAIEVRTITGMKIIKE